MTHEEKEELIEEMAQVGLLSLKSRLGCEIDNLCKIQPCACLTRVSREMLSVIEKRGGYAPRGYWIAPWEPNEKMVSYGVADFRTQHGLFIEFDWMASAYRAIRDAHKM